MGILLYLRRLHLPSSMCVFLECGGVRQYWELRERQSQSQRFKDIKILSGKVFLLLLGRVGVCEGTIQKPTRERERKRDTQKDSSLFPTT